MFETIWINWGLPLFGLLAGVAGLAYSRHIARDFDRRFGSKHHPAE